VQPISGIIQSATAMTILIQLVVQIWVICLLSRAISTAKGLRIEQTALVSLAVMYMNITAVILALQVGLFYNSRIALLQGSTRILFQHHGCTEVVICDICR